MIVFGVFGVCGESIEFADIVDRADFKCGSCCSPDGIIFNNVLSGIPLLCLFKSVILLKVSLLKIVPLLPVILRILSILFRLSFICIVGASSSISKTAFLFPFMLLFLLLIVLFAFVFVFVFVNLLE